MFAFFDTVLEFFYGIGRIFSLMWDAVTGFFEQIGDFFSSVVNPILEVLPNIIGDGLGVVVVIVVALLVGLTIWEIIN